ncbi:phage replisome organizer N-terminal domain-containing protein [Vagococcus fessus]|uniref:phage replisome organizer N-terminal domain-containing protein n=1 Tax=Vagococcus fessus TaxID=120370 RepID=UPI001476712B|nr:phage replisome organizer N-terminal domain-containing protein [Vagococcus fessus]
MSEVKWIKMSTDIPDNKKIKRIRRLPDGNNVALFWLFLLARAGEANSKGGLFISDTIPYTVEDFADDFDFSIEFVNFALITLEKYKMIERYDGILFIRNWEEYQQLDKLEQAKEKTRLRVAKFREKQKQLATEKTVNEDCNVTCNVTVTGCNATEIDIELDKDIDKELTNTNTTNINNKQTTFSKVEQEFGRPLSPIEMETINYWEEDYTEDMIDCAIREAVMNGKYNFKYIEAILRNWEKNNLKTKQAIEESVASFRSNKKSNSVVTSNEELPEVPMVNWVESSE